MSCQIIRLTASRTRETTLRWMRGATFEKASPAHGPGACKNIEKWSTIASSGTPGRSRSPGLLALPGGRDAARKQEHHASSLPGLDPESLSAGSVSEELGGVGGKAGTGGGRLGLGARAGIGGGSCVNGEILNVLNLWQTQTKKGACLAGPLRPLALKLAHQRLVAGLLHRQGIYFTSNSQKIWPCRPPSPKCAARSLPGQRGFMACRTLRAPKL